MLDKNTQKHLQALGLTTVGLLQRFTRNRLAEHFGRQAEVLYNLARGIDNAPVEPLYPPRTVTVHLSLSGGVDSPEAIDTALRRLSGQIVTQLQPRQDVCGRIGIRVSTDEAQEASQSLRLRTPTSEEGDILRACRTLIRRFDLPDPIAAITIKASEVRRARGTQLSLFSTAADPRDRDRTRKALNSVRQQFGEQAAVLGGEIEIPRRERLLLCIGSS